MVIAVEASPPRLWLSRRPSRWLRCEPLGGPRNLATMAGKHGKRRGPRLPPRGSRGPRSRRLADQRPAGDIRRSTWWSTSWWSTSSPETSWPPSTSRGWPAPWSAWPARALARGLLGGRLRLVRRRARRALRGGRGLVGGLLSLRRALGRNRVGLVRGLGLALGSLATQSGDDLLATGHELLVRRDLLSALRDVVAQLLEPGLELVGDLAELVLQLLDAGLGLLRQPLASAWSSVKRASAFFGSARASAWTSLR